MRWLLPLVLFMSGCLCAAPCSQETCSGCCTPDGECQGGLDALACGLGGGACAVCAATQRCTLAGCRTPPDAGHPDAGEGCACPTGCCASDGTCASGSTPSACGPRRSACVTCAAGERCEALACTAAPCGGCVDAAGHCQGGADDFACGADGGLCRACAQGQACATGACAARVCTPQTCGGCCTAVAVCVAVPSPSQCGLVGSPCVSCAPGDFCVAGACR